jgi:hypothetical protein
MINDHGAKMERYWQGKQKNSEKEPVAVQLYPQEIPHELSVARTRVSAVKGRRLTAWAFSCLQLVHYIFYLFR